MRYDYVKIRDKKYMSMVNILTEVKLTNKDKQVFDVQIAVDYVLLYSKRFNFNIVLKYHVTHEKQTMGVKLCRL